MSNKTYHYCFLVLCIILMASVITFAYNIIKIMPNNQSEPNYAEAKVIDKHYEKIQTGSRFVKGWGDSYNQKFSYDYERKILVEFNNDDKTIWYDVNREEYESINKGDCLLIDKNSINFKYKKESK